MKKEFVLVLVLFGALFSPLSAASVAEGDPDKAGKTNVKTVAVEKWEFYSTVQKPTVEELANADNHKFGKEVGYLYHVFMDMYVVKEEVVPGDPARRAVIRKPDIYNAVRSIEKQLNKEMKSNRLTKDAAADKFANVLKIALAAIDSDTSTFEKALYGNKKDSSRLLAIFDNVKLKNLY
ncbi:MAG: hypothetical protein J6K31_03095 [Parabacteroides sp.]|nr:hypothetical protein [Parabacteroides sp.]